MITLNLLHPIDATPIQTWKFESNSVIRIGRSGDNDVILYSSVVSRYHVEIYRHELHWEIVNIGINGIYIDAQPINNERVQDGMIIRLATTGPQLQILVGMDKAASSGESVAIAVTPINPNDSPATLISPK